MIWDVEVGGRVRQVELRGSAVVLDGREVHVDVARFGDGFSLLIGGGVPGSVDEGVCGRSYEVALVERGPQEWLAHVNGKSCVASVLPRRGRAEGAAGSPADARRADSRVGPQRIVAPMPGRIAKVLVTVGDAVSARQGLVVVEAMKMENELKAARAGTVVEVRAVEGARVEANALLVVVE